MFDDYFYQIGQGEIFVKSGCMQHERIITDFFRSTLINLGYITTDSAQRIWKRPGRTVVVCLADDFFVCGAKIDQSPDRWFDSETIVITDNHITVPTHYQVCEFPITYFGVYGFEPGNQDYQPERRCHWSINRIDSLRALIFLEIVRQSGNIGQLTKVDYINFNGWDAQGRNVDKQDVQNNFKKYFDQINSDLTDRYTAFLPQVIDYLPVKNHNSDIEQINVASWLCPVVETYSGDTTMTFSEKIFRALQTPVPWTLFGTTGAVAYLNQLGLDTLSDLVDHNYNNVSQHTSSGIEKISAFVTTSIETATALQGMDLARVKQRCIRAATHNQRVLAEWRRQWPKDLATWLPKIMEKLI